MNYDGRAPERKEPDESVRAFLDYFLCPQEFAQFQLVGKPSTAEGFFSFGSTLCYGKTAADRDPVTVQLSAAATSRSQIPLFFSPTEVVENFRRERYLTTVNTERWLRNLYYFVRPILPLAVRKQLQRGIFRWRNRTFPCWPVDCSVEQIFESLMRLVIQSSNAEVPFIWFWPDGKNCAAMITHDVEEEDGADYCDRLMDLDDSFGIKAAFQLVPEGRYGGVEALVARIRLRGFEANIHDLDHDGRLYDHVTQFQQRALRINEYARKYGMEGFRSRALHRNQDWFKMLDFQYEMSVPTVSHLEPQPGGCCTVTPYFVGDVLELPLTTVQDHGLFYVLNERSIDLWKQQIEMISAHNGLISFIIHPDYILRSEERELYCNLLRYLPVLKESLQIWFTVPNEINCWWRERSQMQLVREQDGWRIDGPGSERARMAYASVGDGKLSYRIMHEHSPCPARAISERETPSQAH